MSLVTAPLSPLSLRRMPRDILSEAARRFELTGHPDLEACQQELERRERVRLAQQKDALLRQALEMRVAMIRTLRQVGA